MIFGVPWFGVFMVPLGIFAIILAFLSAAKGKVDLELIYKLSISDFFKNAAGLVKKFDVFSMIGFACGSAAMVLSVVFSVLSGFVSFMHGL